MSTRLTQRLCVQCSRDRAWGKLAGGITVRDHLRSKIPPTPSPSPTLRGGRGTGFLPSLILGEGSGMGAFQTASDAHGLLPLSGLTGEGAGG